MEKREMLAKICLKYIDGIEKQNEEERESNEIYGEILAVLIKNPNLNLYELIEEINRGSINYEKNKIRNRRDRIVGVHKSIKEATEILKLILSGTEKDFEKITTILKENNIYRNRMVLKLLFDEFPSPEMQKVYYGIKNEQCKKIIVELIENIGGNK